MKTNFITSQFAILFLSVGVLIAQPSTSLKEKIKNIKGDINSITIATTEGNVTFEGEEARKLFKKMKSKTLHKKLKFISENGGGLNFEDDDIDVLVFKNSNSMKLTDDGKQVTINVEEENGETKVTVTTKEDGEETVKTYEGKEAKKFLKDNNDKHNMIIDKDDAMREIRIYSGTDSTMTEKDIDVKIIDGVKTVTVITIKDGDKNVKIYKGERAEKYIEEMGLDEGSFKVFQDMKNGKETNKIILKK